jgi:hypothetical protein
MFGFYFYFIKEEAKCLFYMVYGQMPANSSLQC